jgi:hypothetical protein
MGRSTRQYSKSDTYELTATLLHRLFDNSPELMIVNSVFQGSAEQDPAETTQKSIGATNSRPSRSSQ